MSATPRIYNTAKWEEMERDLNDFERRPRKKVMTPRTSDDKAWVDSAGWDVVVVYNANEEDADKKKMHRAMAARMRCVGLKVALDKSRDDDEILIKITAPIKKLQDAAEDAHMEMRLKTGGYAEFTKKTKHLFLGSGYFNKKLNQHEPDGKFFTSLERGRLIFLILEANKADGGCNLDLDGLKADKVINQAFPLHDPKGVEYLMKHWFHNGGGFLGWKSLFRSQPFDAIRDYFGEKIALYFCFLGFYKDSLVWPSIVGMAMVIFSAYVGTLDNNFVPIYCGFVILWTVYFLKYWKRRNLEMAYHWNVTDFEEEERDRPEFFGSTLKKGIYTKTGGFVEIKPDHPSYEYAPLYPYFSKLEALKRRLLTWAVAIPFMVAVVAGAIGILAYRGFLMLQFAKGVHGDWPNFSAAKGQFNVQVGSGLGGGLNGGFIAFMNAVYEKMAVFLTDFENHRTDTIYEDALIRKTFLFQFVNSYVSLFYVAFIKSAGISLIKVDSTMFADEWCHDMSKNKTTKASHYTNTEAEIEQEYYETHGHHQRLNPNCMSELANLLISLVIAKQVMGQAQEMMIPRIKFYMKNYMEERALRKKLGKGVALPEMTAIEVEAKMDPYEGVFKDYNELVLQFGYIVLFAAAFPIASIFSLGNNIAEIKSDAYKLLKLTQRPRYAGTEDIGSWYNMLDTVSNVAVLTNLAIIFFTSTFLSSHLPLPIVGHAEITMDNKIWSMVFLEHVILIFKYSLSRFVPDKSDSIAAIEAQQQWEFELMMNAENNKPPVPEKWDDSKIPKEYWDW